jgi:exopolyphosphatase / guanosine-5'-triphosphate,3'-diphosphate pyrophosphatase
LTRPELVRDSDDKPRGDQRAAVAQRIAAIDIGSNSIRQIVADVGPTGAIRVVDEMKAQPRLGAGLMKSGELDAAAMRRSVEALVRMGTLARQLGAARVEAVATSAVREARNRSAFLDVVRHEAGLRVRLLDGEEEARLAFLSALAHFELGEGRWMVMDIGGGSIELALSADGLLERLISLPLGALRATEQFLSDGVTPKRVRRLRKAVRAELKQVLPARDWRGARVIGSGGTFTNLAGMHLARMGMHAAQTVHGTRVPRVDIERLLDHLIEMDASERSGVAGLSPGRADIIVGGLAVAAEVMSRIEAQEIDVSAYGIREGLLLDSARVLPPVADPGQARERSVREFAERCHYEEPHSRQVRKLALELYDSLGAKLGCGGSDRQVLADAALLHDVGYHINYERHHKHSYHLIVHADFLGMSPTEQVLVANVARYHRGARPKKKHRNLSSLDPSLREKVEVLSAMLRVADGLDRGHAQAVESLKVRRTPRAIRVTPVPRKGASLRLELWGANRKARLLGKVAGVPVEIVSPDGTVVREEDDED